MSALKLFMPNHQSSLPKQNYYKHTLINLLQLYSAHCSEDRTGSRNRHSKSSLVLYLQLDCRRAPGFDDGLFHLCVSAAMCGGKLRQRGDWGSR